MLFGLTQMWQSKPDKWREVCYDSINQNIMCITQHPSHDIHVCPGIIGEPYKWSYLLWIFLSPSFLGR